VRYFAKSTGGFYDSVIHGDHIPTDAVEITADQHAALLAAQSAGQAISADGKGRPVAVDPATLITLDQARRAQLEALRAACRAQIGAGFASAALGISLDYGGARTDQDNINAVAAAGGGSLWCADSADAWTFATHDAAQAAQVQKDLVAHVQAAQAHYAALRTQAAEAATVAAARAVVW